MSKYQISFNIDATHLIPEGHADIAQVEEYIRTTLMEAARAQSKAGLRKIRNDDHLDLDVKAIQSAEKLREIMLSLMSEANLVVTEVADDTEVSTTLPFER